MDLDDLLDDLDDRIEDVVKDARRRAGERLRQGRQELRRATRAPGVRARLRSGLLWGSVAWGSVFGGSAVATELAFDGGLATFAAVILGGLALPAIPTGVWAARTRTRDREAHRVAAADRSAREQLAAMPVDVVADWRKLRRAEALVVDLAGEGLVDPHAVEELGATADRLERLLVADRRAAELGAAPSVQLRTQVAELADLLVALAAEAVEHHTEAVAAEPTPATLREATDRLAAMREARAEVARADRSMPDAAAAAEDLLRRSSPSPPPAAGDDGDHGLQPG